jgi:hypothetical protein
MNTIHKYSPEIRERALRMVFEHQSEHESGVGGDRQVYTELVPGALQQAPWSRSNAKGV